jgi:membrane fusion protein (multidrug efflux system)
MKRQQKVMWLIIGAFLMGVLGSCAHSGGAEDPENTAVAVGLMNVTARPVIYYDSYPGNTVALKEVQLRGQVSGYITTIHFKEGSLVQKGQLLYEIDPRTYQATYDQAKNNLKIAEDNLHKEQQDVDRYTYLDQQHAIARQTLDYAQTDLNNGELLVAVARKQLEKARTDLDYSRITAPFDGTIGISQVKLGSLVTPGQTLLNTVSSNDPMGVDFVVDEKDLGRMEQLDTIPPQKTDSTFQLVLPDKSMYPFYGNIYLIDRAVDPQTGTIKVRLEFPNPKLSLKPGMNCDVRIRNEYATPQIMIPFKAVLEQMGEYFVFVDQQGKADQVKVRIGRQIGDDVIIRDGLSSGTRIVVDGIQKIRQDSPLKAAEAAR